MMVPTLQLDPSSMIIDVALAQRVPQALSRYYLALPIGQDNGTVSVAMAYPQNVKAQQVLGRLLKAQVVPVFIPAERLLPVLERVYCPENQERQEILSWCDQPEWETAVRKAAAMLGAVRHVGETSCATAGLSLDEVLNLAAAGKYELFVMPTPAPAMLPTILNRTVMPLFFVRGEQPMIGRILVAMRGFASDEQVLDWLIPFAQQQRAALTLMPLASGCGSHWHPFHSQDSPAGQHLERCHQQLQTRGISFTLKYRFGDAVEQVVDEVRGNDYDLLVLAAEADGGFVSQMITAIDQHKVHLNSAIFVLRPPVQP